MLNVTVNLLYRHQKKYSLRQSNTSITTYFGESSLSHGSKVLSTEVMMAQPSLA